MSNNGGGYIKSLDGVRAICILLVMVHHADMAHFAWMGVQFFFVLSGFLIMGILWKEKFNDEETTLFKFKKFWVRRSLRIFPLYYGYIFFWGITYLIWQFPVYYKFFFPYLATYTVNYTRLMPDWQENPLFIHLWSLSVEEQFYLFFPLIFFLSPPKFIKKLLIAIVFISPVLRFLLGEYFKSKGVSGMLVANAVNFNALSHLDGFCMGGIIAVFSLHKSVDRPVRYLRAIIIIAIAAGAINYIFSGSTLDYWNDFGYNHTLINNYQHVWHYTLINAVCACLILTLISVKSRNSIPMVRKVLEHKWMVGIGKVSYGMYVLHWLVLTYCFRNFHWTDSLLVKWLMIIPYIAVTWLLAEISYRFWEAPFLKLKDKFFPARKKPDATAPVPATETLAN